MKVMLTLLLGLFHFHQNSEKKEKGAVTLAA